MRLFLASLMLLTGMGCGRAEVFPEGNPTLSSAGGGAGGGGEGGGTGPVALVFTEGGGCGDAFFFAINGDATAMVTVSWPRRIEANPPTSELTLPTSQVLKDAPVIRLHRGKLLRDFACNDAAQPSAVDNHGELLSGTVKVEIGVGRESGPFGTMTLSHAVFADPSGGTLRLELLVVGPVNIGWFPG